MLKKQFSFVKQEVLEMLEKGAIQQVVSTHGQFPSNLLLVEKRDGGNHPFINFKNVNKFIPCKHFKIERFYCLKFFLGHDDLLCKIDLNEAYFPDPPTKTHKSL